MMGIYLRRFGVFLLLGILFFSPFLNCLCAEDNQKENKLNKEFLKNLTSDFGKVLVSPKDWDKKDLGNFALVLGTGLLLYSLDQEIQQGLGNDTNNDAVNLITSLGNGGTLAGLAAALYVGGEVSNNDGLRKTALLSLESLLTSGIIVRGMKILVGRARPQTGEPYNTFDPFSLGANYNSFPSGHSAAAFSVASVIASQSKDTNIDFLAYGLATFIALSRIYQNKHWASDIFIGSVIGYVVGKKICALNRDRNPNKVQLGFQFTPQRKAITVSIYF
jgi:membrane-associated phospholipid phosphatase